MASDAVIVKDETLGQLLRLYPSNGSRRGIERMHGRAKPADQLQIKGDVRADPERIDHAPFGQPVWADAPVRIVIAKAYLWAGLLNSYMHVPAPPGTIYVPRTTDLVLQIFHLYPVPGIPGTHVCAHSPAVKTPQQFSALSPWRLLAGFRKRRARHF